MKEKTKQLTAPSIAVLSILLLVSTAQVLFTLLRSSKFEKMFNEMLQGAALPPTTEFFLAYGNQISIALGLASLVGVFSLIRIREKTWPTVLCGSLLFLNAATGGLAIESYYRPIIDIITQLTG